MSHRFSPGMLHLIWESELPTFHFIPDHPTVCFAQASCFLSLLSAGLCQGVLVFQMLWPEQEELGILFWKFAMIVHCLIHLQSWNNSSVSTVLKGRKKPTSS